MKYSNNEIAVAWIEFCKSDIQPKTSTLVADKLDDLVSTDPEEAWKIIDIILSMDASDDVLATTGAGPMEDILCKHGEQFIERIEDRARADKAFKKLLGAVWGENRMPSEIWIRIKAVAGGAF